MATLLITKVEGDVTIQGTLEWCIDQALDGDTIKLDPSVFPDYAMAYLDIQGRELALTKSLTITAGDHRTIVLKAGTGSARRFRIAGSSGNTINVTLERVWSRGFTSTASSTGTCLNANYADVHLNQCCFCACSSPGNNSGLYAANSAVEIKSSIIEVDAGNAVNYSSNAVVVAFSSTFIGSTKADMTASDTIAISPSVASTHLVDPSRMNYNVLSTSPYAEGRTLTADKDMNGNDFALDGPLGALQTAPLFDGVSASYSNGIITFSGGFITSNIAVNDGLNTIAYSRASNVPTSRTAAGFTLSEMNGDSWKDITVTVTLDEDWYRAFCLSLDIPITDMNHAKQIFGEHISKFSQN